MRDSWSFSIGVDASTNRFGHTHLDARSRLPPTQLGKHIMSFHLLAIPLFEKSHSGESFHDFMVYLLSSLCPDCHKRFIGS